MKKLPLILLALLLAACALLAGCDYPEAGFYEISVVDGAKQIASFPFMIEELTDDTDLTVGFNILLPRSGELVVVNMKNGEDYSKRSWEIRMAQGDSGYGDIQMELVHANDVLSFNGARRDPDAGQSEKFRGKDLTEFAGKVIPDEDDSERPAAITFDGVLPQSLLDGRANDAKWTLRGISQAQFEKALGMKVADAPRREAPFVSSFRPEKTEPQKVRGVSPGKYKKTTPGGERKIGP